MSRHEWTRPGRALLAMAAALAITLVAGVAGTAAARSEVDFEWSGKIVRGQTIEIRGINGEIRAVPARGTEARVTAVKRARRGDPDEVRIEVSEGRDGVRICAIYPGSRNGCDDDGDRRRGGRHRKNDTVVDFEVEVPAGARFVGRTVNGEIVAEDLDGDAEAMTVNGSIRIAANGFVQATTVNGSIRAAMGSRDWKEDAEFTTVNGSITLELPGTPNAEVHATTVNGSISTDFPLTVRGKFIGRSVSGTLGRGGPDLTLTTVNGSIKLRSATS